MATEQFTNNAISTLSGVVLSSDLSFSVASAATFPAVPQFRVLVDDEIMLVTGVIGNTFTVLRGQEGTSAAGHALGAQITHMLTAGALEQLKSDTFTPDGDLSGSGISQTVIGLQGHAVATGTPSNGQVLTWVTAGSEWAPLTPSFSLPAHSTSHKNGGSDEVAVATAAASAIPKASGTGKLDIGWIPTGSTNVTVCIGNDSRLSDARTPSGSASGDLSSNYPGPTVAKIQGNAVLSGTPSNGQVLTWITANTRWEPTTPGASLTGYTNSVSPFNTALGWLAGTATPTGVDNLCLGYGAGTLVSTGNRNTLIGSMAGDALTTTSDNTCIGYNAGTAMTVGSNVIIGAYAGQALTTSPFTVIIGRDAAYSATANISGSVIIGYQAGYQLTGNGTNIAIGQQALYSAVASAHYDNVAIGYQSLLAMSSGTGNIGIGSATGDAITSGAGNTLVGSGCGGAFSTGNYNASIGYNSLLSATAGLANCSVLGAFAMSNSAGGNATAVGYGALQNAAGAQNVALGYQAMNQVFAAGAVTNVAVGYQSAYQCSMALSVCLGYRAGFQVGAGTDNVFIGNQAAGGAGAGIATYNIGIGSSALFDVTSGSYNLAQGFQAGNTITTGTYNICIGYDADVGGATETNEIAIGYGTTGKGSNTTVIGRSAATATTDIWLRGNTAHIGNEAAAANVSLLFETTDSLTNIPGVRWNSTGVAMEYSDGAGWATFASLSDARLKKNVEPLQHGLDFVNALRPRMFDWIAPTNEPMKRKQMGFVAQELKQDVNSQGLEGGVYKDDGANWSIDYDQLIAPLVKAVQELAAQVVELKSELAELKK